jgi:hypothetical protein
VGAAAAADDIDVLPLSEVLGAGSGPGNDGIRAAAIRGCYVVPRAAVGIAVGVDGGESF